MLSPSRQRRVHVYDVYFVQVYTTKTKLTSEKQISDVCEYVCTSHIRYIFAMEEAHSQYV